MVKRQRLNGRDAADGRHQQCGQVMCNGVKGGAGIEAYQPCLYTILLKMRVICIGRRSHPPPCRDAGDALPHSTDKASLKKTLSPPRYSPSSGAAPTSMSSSPSRGARRRDEEREEEEEARAESVEVAIVGAGFAGICVAIKLKEVREEDGNREGQGTGLDIRTKKAAKGKRGKDGGGAKD